MKIIKPGNSPDEQPLRGTCRVCGCEVEVPKKEAKWMDGDRSWEPGSHYVDCPTRGCDGDIWLKGG